MAPVSCSCLERHERIINAMTMGHARTTCPDILLCKEEVCLTPVKLDGAKSGWHYTNIDAVYGKNLRMSTPSKSQSSAMGGKDYFVWRERMEKR
ncbi:hypothetical protein CK203_025412 [Vitis vinifera]|uniref:Uncharacterized protein n=1 Tax=Vitis vinifera TaxID=29760 RepID=A0A438IZT4_VITVI|nr:hypothetical protein CK203_025412 [Vitis vinifera]